MATYTATAAQTAVQAKATRVGLTFVRSIYSQDVSISINTNIEMVKVPAGASVAYMQYGILGVADATVGVGDSVAAQRYRSMATYSAGLGMLSPTIIQPPYVYSADDKIVIRVSLASASTLAGAYYMNVIFTMDADPK